MDKELQEIFQKDAIKANNRQEWEMLMSHAFEKKKLDSYVELKMKGQGEIDRMLEEVRIIDADGTISNREKREKAKPILAEVEQAKGYLKNLAARIQEASQSVSHHMSRALYFRALAEHASTFLIETPEERADREKRDKEAHLEAERAADQEPPAPVDNTLDVRSEQE